MNTDRLLDRLREWRSFRYSHDLPQAVVLAERDWVAYVQAMANAVPEGARLDFPSEQDVLWSWPDGVIVAFSEPLRIEHTIVSHSYLDDHNRLVEETTPAHIEEQAAACLVICAPRMMPAQLPDGTPRDAVRAYPSLWIGDDPSDVINAHWMPGTGMLPSPTGSFSHSSRLLLSIITALGHRLTRLDQPAGTRGERRRVERELPRLRVLRLASGASVANRGGSVEWSRRWMVRGHWRLQPYGPQRSLVRPVWIDPYVKGPDDKPLDVRPTIWRATTP